MRCPDFKEFYHYYSKGNDGLAEEKRRGREGLEAHTAPPKMEDDDYGIMMDDTGSEWSEEEEEVQGLLLDGQRLRHLSLRKDEDAFPGLKLKFQKETQGEAQCERAVQEMLGLLRACRESFPSSPDELTPAHMAAVAWGKSARNAGTRDFLGLILAHAESHMAKVKRDYDSKRSAPQVYQALWTVKLDTAFLARWLYTYFALVQVSGGATAYFASDDHAKYMEASVIMQQEPNLDTVMALRARAESQRALHAANGVPEGQFRAFLKCLDPVPGSPTDIPSDCLRQSYKGFSSHFCNLALEALDDYCIDDTKIESMAKKGDNAGCSKRTSNDRRYITTVHTMAEDGHRHTERKEIVEPASGSSEPRRWCP